MSAQMIVRIDPDLKDRVNRFARAEGKNLSEVVRELLERYVRDRDISAYIDEVWDRVGAKIRERGFSSEEIDSVIEQVRAGRR